MRKKFLSIGLKLWSNNERYVQEATDLFSKGIYQYIELYVVPETSGTCLPLWGALNKEHNIPFIIHAPHYGAGLNLAVKEKEKSNRVMIDETRLFADQLRADTIIFHPGIAGDIKETIRQFQSINDDRIVVENKPYYTVDQSAICNGYSPEDIKRVTEEAHVGFCLDIGHAICAANALKEPVFEFLKRLMALQPTLYHVSDGDYSGVIDTHQHFGEGTFPLRDIFNALPENAKVTYEAVKDYSDSLRDFVEDIDRLHRVYL